MVGVRCTALPSRPPRDGLWQPQRHASDVMIHGEGKIPQDIHTQQPLAAVSAREIAEDHRQIGHTEALDLQLPDSDGRQAARAARRLHVDPGHRRVAPIPEAVGGPHGQQRDGGASIDNAGDFQLPVDHHRNFNPRRAGGKSMTAVCGPPWRARALVR